jgi:ribosomal protein S6
MTTDKEVEKEIVEDEDPKIYEVGFHVVPTTAEDDLSSVVNAIRNDIESASGVIMSEGTPEMVQLAYPMDHIVANKKSIFDSAYFGWIKFQVVPGSILKIKDNFEKNNDVFRFLIINTVKEDTISRKPAVKARKASSKSDMSTKAGMKKEPKEEISVSEVDKAIEELVVE